MKGNLVYTIGDKGRDEVSEVDGRRSLQYRTSPVRLLLA